MANSDNDFPRMRLRELRDARGMTQAEMAEVIGVGQNTYQRWETHEVNPWARCVLIATKLGVDLIQLVPDELREALAPSPIAGLDPTEAKWLDRFSRLGASQRRLVTSLMAAVAIDDPDMIDELAEMSDEQRGTVLAVARAVATRQVETD